MDLVRFGVQYCEIKVQFSTVREDKLLIEDVNVSLRCGFSEDFCEISRMATFLESATFLDTWLRCRGLLQDAIN
jgi:hypothetical protein